MPLGTGDPKGRPYTGHPIAGGGRVSRLSSTSFVQNETLTLRGGRP